MKKAENCKNISEIRAGINRLDHEVISLSKQRFEFVKADSRFKSDEASIRASEQFRAMLEQRKTCAREEGLNADAIISSKKN